MEDNYIANPIGWCVKCKKKVPIQDSHEETMKGSKGERRMAKGRCPDCSTKVCAILKSK